MGGFDKWLSDGRRDGTQLVGEGDTVSLVMQVKHKYACMGERLVDHESGRVWVFGFFFFNWALRLFIFLGNWAYIG